MMTRHRILLSAGIVVLTSGIVAGDGQRGQAPAPAPAAAATQQDFSAVKIVTTKITDSFSAIDGQGGRMGVQSGPDGVDAQGFGHPTVGRKGPRRRHAARRTARAKHSQERARWQTELFVRSPAARIGPQSAGQQE